MRRTRAAAAIVAAAIMLAAVGAPAKTIRIDVESLAFRPAQVTAHVGDTVEWANNDFLDHTATARNHAWDLPLPVGKTAKVRLKKAGAVEYFCRIHPNMTGTITVEEAKR